MQQHGTLRHAAQETTSVAEARHRMARFAKRAMAWFGAPQQEGVDKDGGAGEDERRLEAAAAAGERVVQQVRRRPERVARLPAGRLGAGGFGAGRPARSPARSRSEVSERGRGRERKSAGLVMGGGEGVGGGWGERYKRGMVWRRLTR